LSYCERALVLFFLTCVSIMWLFFPSFPFAVVASEFCLLYDRLVVDFFFLFVSCLLEIYDLRGYDFSCSFVSRLITFCVTGNVLTSHSLVVVDVISIISC